ncbi:MAG: hypothetical protein HFH68_08525 [Lachnospiraceae bacterium]|nr:hypothetical protein [Lachnospiraceae bacterium]
MESKKPENVVKLSPLAKTWILDLDGTILRHNGYKTGKDSFLDGAEQFLKEIPEEDMVVFVTSRTTSEKEITEDFLRKNNIRYNTVIYNAPYGERILINDAKPSGLKTALAYTTKRDEFCKVSFEIDNTK